MISKVESAPELVGILVTDRITFFEQAEKNAIPLGDWFSSPLHPITDNMKEWGLDVTLIPNAVRVSQQIVNLPTLFKHPQRICDFLSTHHHLIV